jgi:hypothetical protein
MMKKSIEVLKEADRKEASFQSKVMKRLKSQDYLKYTLVKLKAELIQRLKKEYELVRKLKNKSLL